MKHSQLHILHCFDVRQMPAKLPQNFILLKGFYDVNLTNDKRNEIITVIDLCYHNLIC